MRKYKNGFHRNSVFLNDYMTKSSLFPFSFMQENIFPPVQNKVQLKQTRISFTPSGCKQIPNFLKFVASLGIFDLSFYCGKSDQSSAISRVKNITDNKFAFTKPKLHESVSNY